MDNRLYVKVFGDLAAYQEMFPNEYRSIEPDFEKMMDSLVIRCLYLIQDFPDGCHANCAFCTQGLESRNKRKEAYLINKYLIKFPVKRLLKLIEEGFLERRKFERICYSAVYHPKTNENLIEVFKELRRVTDIPLTACCIPDSKKTLLAIKDAGADRVVINFEIASPELFEKYRGRQRKYSPYTWEKVDRTVNEALEVFGPSRVGTHLLIGIGETHAEALRFIQNQYDRKVNVSLFAFRPVVDTDLENHPEISHRDYHKVQIGRYLMLQNKVRFEDFKFNAAGEIIDYGIDKAAVIDLINSGKPFRNMGGCPHCNRVFYDNEYDERHYNYPRDPYPREIEIIRAELLSSANELI
jgi:biotin synthase-related radical SAM superfamily protein